jgi:nitric oxide reductase NorD protein
MAENDLSESDKPTITGLARRLGKLPTEKKRAALETSAALAGVSLRVSREFVEAVPAAAKILSADELRSWGEMGRRLAMGSADVGSAFFAEGVDGLRNVPAEARSALFQVCMRQLVLSSSTALETFHLISGLAAEIADDDLLTNVLKLAVEVAHRSAKHSSELLLSTPTLAAALVPFGDERQKVSDAVLLLARMFADRTGGMTADLWSRLPEDLKGLSAPNAVELMRHASDFLEFGGSVTLHFVSSGSSVMKHAAASFGDWCQLARIIAGHGNAVLISFLRATPQFISQSGRPGHDSRDISRVLQLVARIGETDAESALAALRSSRGVLNNVSIDQFEQWVETGLEPGDGTSRRARRSYFALETRESNERLQDARLGLPLESVQPVLRMYIEALTGKEIEVAPFSAVNQGSRIGDGKTIYLPAAVAAFDDDEMDFRLYKVLSAHGAGQIEFGTFEKDTRGLKAAYAELEGLFSATADQLDAFSLAGYIEDVASGQKALTPEQQGAEDKKKAASLPKGSDYRAVLNVFPDPALARKIFSTMENARIDNRLRYTYRGLVKDLDLMRTHLGENRPYIFDLPMHQVPFELLFQITLCGGATDDAKRFYRQIVSEIETVVEKYLQHSRGEANGRSRVFPTVADSLMATSRVYTLFQTLSPEQTAETDAEENEGDSAFAYEDKDAAEAVTEDQVKREQKKNPQDVSDLFNAWNSLDDEGEPDDLHGSETWSQGEVPEQPLEPGDEAFAYDEWDRELSDYRVGWSRVIEKNAKQGDRNFVELARSRYRGVISSIRQQFQLMKPENLTRINRELDGEDYDLNALVDFVIDRKADGQQSENIYTKRLRRQRDVAVSILLDQSSSTARTITRNPLQPYTHPGRRIIEIEKEGLVLMSEALEAVGDVYSIYGFTSEGRRNVKFYVVKDFGEKYSDVIERRIGGITFQNNTRLGAAIRHAAAKLLKQESRTKLLIILTDGRPYDHDYGDARYAREDVREALTEAKSMGLIPFCITVDRESEAELKDLYGNVGYTIIDDVLSLPERMPNIYRRLTS